MSAKLIKAQLLNGACTLAGAVLTNLPDTQVADPQLQNEELRKGNIQGAQLVKVFYDYLRRALESDSAQDGWADPKVPDDVAVAGQDGILAAALKALPADALQLLIGKIPTEALNAIIGKIPSPSTAPQQLP